MTCVLIHSLTIRILRISGRFGTLKSACHVLFAAPGPVVPTLKAYVALKNQDTNDTSTCGIRHKDTQWSQSPENISKCFATTRLASNHETRRQHTDNTIMLPLNT